MVDSTNSLRARVAALIEAEPALAGALEARGASIELIARAEVEVPELRVPADLVRARLTAGVPLLDRLPLPVGGASTALFERLAVVLLVEPAARQHAVAILTAIRAHQLHPEQLVSEAAVGHDDHLAALAAPFAEAASGEGVGEGQGIGSIVAQLAGLAALPLLEALAGRLRPALRLGSWSRGYCPICGGRPLLAEIDPPGFDDVPGAERLRCGRCATGWAWTLPHCPDCSEGLLIVEDTLDAPDLGEWRLARCNACRSYVKIASRPRSDQLAMLLVDDLATWRLDRAALDRGLARPSGAGFRLEHGEVPGEALDDD